MFVDTSAIVALLDADDRRHSAAGELWTRALTEGWRLHTSDLVVVETWAILQRRFELSVVRRFHRDIVPLLSVWWIERAAYDEAAEEALLANRRNLSLVDCVSFATMRQLGIRDAFTFDPHFAEQGFNVLPAPTSA